MSKSLIRSGGDVALLTERLQAIRKRLESDSLIERFRKYAMQQEGCWVWTGPRNGSGYGTLRNRGKGIQAHRIAYELVHGSIPPNLLVCHTCDIRLCVRPDHLFLGTPKDNSQDARKKGRLVNSSDQADVRRKISEVLRGRPKSRECIEKRKRTLRERYKDPVRKAALLAHLLAARWPKHAVR